MGNPILSPSAMRSRSARAIAMGSVSVAVLAGCGLVLGFEDHQPYPADGGAAGDASADGSIPSGPKRCSKDDECVAPDACYKGRCDLAEGVCLFDVCPDTAPCSIGVCNAARTCEKPVPYKFDAVAIPIKDAGLGCGQDASKCFAVAYPYAFVGTTTNVQVREVSQLNSTAPRVVPLDGVDFAPDRIVASDHRVWFLKVDGIQKPYKLTVAWLDVTTDPTVPRLVARKAILDYPFASATPFVAPGGDLYVLFADADRKHPVVRLKPDLETGQTIEVTPTAATYPMFESQNVPKDFVFVASSANRLLSFQAAGGVASFSLLPNPATATAQSLAAETKSFLGPDPGCGGRGIRYAQFASGRDGTVFAAASLAAGSCGSNAIATWIIPDAEALKPGADPLTDLEGYAGGTEIGAVAWLGTTQALVVAGRTNAPARTSVRVVNRAGGVPAGRDKPIENVTINVNKIGAAGSSNFGFVLTADAQGTNMTVRVYDPRCQ